MSQNKPNTDDSRQSDLAVMDAEEYKQKRRLRRILDARDKVEEKQDNASEMIAEGHLSADGKNIVILHAVQEYIRECYNLLMGYHESDDGGRADVQPDYWSNWKLGEIDMATTENETFDGLGDVLYAENFYTESWTEQVSTRHGPDQEETYQQQHTVPEEVSMNAYLLLNKFLANETNLDLQFEDDSLPTDQF